MNQTLFRFAAEGPARFNQSALLLAPFFRGLRSTINQLTATGAELTMPTPGDIGSGDSHLHTADDAALCALALRAAGLVLDAGVPDNGRWRLKGFEVVCNADRPQAEVTAVADASGVDWSVPGEYAVSVQLLAARREQVAAMTLTIAISQA